MSNTYGRGYSGNQYQPVLAKRFDSATGTCNTPTVDTPRTPLMPIAATQIHCETTASGDTCKWTKTSRETAWHATVLSTRDGFTSQSPAQIHTPHTLSLVLIIIGAPMASFARIFMVVAIIVSAATILVCLAYYFQSHPCGIGYYTTHSYSMGTEHFQCHVQGQP